MAMVLDGDGGGVGWRPSRRRRRPAGGSEADGGDDGAEGSQRAAVREDEERDNEFEIHGHIGQQQGGSADPWTVTSDPWAREEGALEWRGWETSWCPPRSTWSWSWWDRPAGGWHDSWGAWSSYDWSGGWYGGYGDRGPQVQGDNLVRPWGQPHVHDQDHQSGVG